MDYFKLDMPRDELLSMSSLGLAHLGDGVFEVMVRSWLCLRGKAVPVISTGPQSNMWPPLPRPRPLSGCSPS